MAKKTYVLDTNVYLTDHNCVYKFKSNNIIVPLKVLDEIDKHKKRQDMVGIHARNIIRFLDNLRKKGNLFKGVRVGRGKGILSIKSFDPFILPDDLDLEDSDNKIIATALSEQKMNPICKVIVVSKDINMRVKCDALGLDSEDYIDEEVIPDITGIYTGVKEILVEDKIIEDFYNSKEIYIEEIPSVNLLPNQFGFLKSELNDKRACFVRKTKNNMIRMVNNSNGAWGLSSRNKEQLLALDLLMDPDVPVVTLMGKAGSGKTLLALAAALQQTVEGTVYKKIIVTKPIQAMGKDIGYLPGTMEEKMDPWIAPIKDNLSFLFKDNKTTMNMYFDEGKIEVEAMTYIRGRSITNAFMIIDEVQNMSQHEIKTVLTRVGEGTKIVLTGDVEQIDNVYINSTTNGLTYVVEKFKNQEIAGHVTLIKGERSQVATISAKIL